MNEIFKHKFVINLDRRKDRREQYEAEFEKHGIKNVERISAVDGNLIDIVSPINKGEIGVMRSHKNIYKYCLENNIDQCLIFEDDVQFFPDVKNFKSWYAEVPEDWQIIYLGGNHLCSPLQQVSERVYKTVYSLTTHAYAIKKDMMQFVLNISNEEQHPIDVYLGNATRHFPSYAFVPVLAVQRDSFSDIQQQQNDYKFLHLGRESYRPPQ